MPTVFRCFSNQQNGLLLVLEQKFHSGGAGGFQRRERQEVARLEYDNSRIDLAQAAGTLPASADAAAFIPPLAVSGLVVTKDALLAALRLYVPQLINLESLEGERFLLVVAGALPEGRAAAEGQGDFRDRR